MLVDVTLVEPMNQSYPSLQVMPQNKKRAKPEQSGRSVVLLHAIFDGISAVTDVAQVTVHALHQAVAAVSHSRSTV